MKIKYQALKYLLILSIGFMETFTVGTTRNLRRVNKKVNNVVPRYEDAILYVPENCEESTEFGLSVSVDGNMALVGAPYVNHENGAAYVFFKDLGSGNWTNHTAVLNYGDYWGSSAHLGSAVSLSKNTALVGAPRKDVNGKQFAGEAYIFAYDELQNNWTNQKLNNADGKWDEQFGHSVFISGSLALVGTGIASSDKNNFVQIYEQDLDNGEWKANTKLQPLTNNPGRFGFSIAASINVTEGKSYIIIGSPRPHHATSGYAYLYQKENGADWNFNSPKTLSAAGISFGGSVSIDGQFLIIGAPDKDKNKGAAYIYQKGGDSEWNEELPQPIHARDGSHGDAFGGSVSISKNIAVVGAVGVDGNQGAAYVFCWSEKSSRWIEKEKLVAKDGEKKDKFGSSVSISKNKMVVVGAPYARPAKCNKGKAKPGAAYVFDLSGLQCDIDDDEPDGDDEGCICTDFMTLEDCINNESCDGNDCVWLVTKDTDGTCIDSSSGICSYFECGLG